MSPPESSQRSVLARADPFVDAYLGVGLLVGMPTLILHDLYYGPSPSAAFVLGVLAVALLASYPFATGRLSTDWLRTYVLWFVVGIFGTVLLGAAIVTGSGVEFPGTDATSRVFLVGLAHLVGLAGATVGDARLRPEEPVTGA